jgi:hypothetical protein
MAKQKNHIPGLIEKLHEYAEKRSLDFAQYSPYHLRIMDGGYVVVDFWTTGRYYIVMTDYYLMTDNNVIERQGEKGSVPVETLNNFLDGIFYPNEANIE